MSDIGDVSRQWRKGCAQFAACVLLAVAVVAAIVALAGCNQAQQPAPSVTAMPAQVVAAPAAQPTPVSVALAEPPRAALAFRDLTIRTARAVWGLDAPVAVFAAQIHQESAWNPRAVSKAGAAGLAQFMPATAKWIGSLDPELREQQPFNPSWSMHAMVKYDQWLFARAPKRYGEFDRMWVALRGYNGGLGHWQAEAAASGAAQPTRLQVDLACGRGKRAALHCSENLGYPHRILQVHQPRYAQWGPGL